MKIPNILKIQFYNEPPCTHYPTLIIINLWSALFTLSPTSPSPIFFKQISSVMTLSNVHLSLCWADTVVLDSTKGTILSFHMFTLLHLFLYLVLATLGLHCRTKAFSSCGEQGPLPSCDGQASPGRGFSCWQHRLQSSAAVAYGLSCSSACGIFPD